MVNIDTWKNPLLPDAYHFTPDELAAFKTGNRTDLLREAACQIVVRVGVGLAPGDNEVPGAATDLNQLMDTLTSGAMGTDPDSYTQLKVTAAFAEGALKGTTLYKLMDADNPIGDIQRVINRQQSESVHNLTEALREVIKTTGGNQ